MDEEYSWKLSVNYILNVSRPVWTSGLCNDCIGCKKPLWVYLGKKTIPLGWKLLPQIHESLFLPVSQKKETLLDWSIAWQR